VQPGGDGSPVIRKELESSRLTTYMMTTFSFCFSFVSVFVCLFVSCEYSGAERGNGGN
jgi:hypothetical protein